MALFRGQIALLAKHAMRGPRKTVKWCNRCGGKHAGLCELRITDTGTRCRPDILAAVERRNRMAR